MVEKGLKACNKQRFYLTHEFVSELFMSMPHTLQQPRDVIHRHLLQLVKDLHQELLIEELLEPCQSKSKKKKHKKKGKAAAQIGEDRAN